MRPRARHPGRVRSPGHEPSDLIRSVSRALRIIEEVSRSPRPAPGGRHGATSYLAGISAGRLVIMDLAEGGRSPWLEDLQPGLETAAHATALGKALLTTLPGRARAGLLAEHGMRTAGGRSASRPAGSACPGRCWPSCGWPRPTSAAVCAEPADRARPGTRRRRGRSMS